MWFRMETECDNCDYEWNYTGKLENTTCPNCNRKTTVGAADA